MNRLTALFFLLLFLPVTSLVADEISSPVKPQVKHAPLWQWGGLSVIVNDEQGNWAEALTGYLSDHGAAEREGRGADFRKQLLLDYSERMNGQNELSLREIRADRKGPAARAVSYNKGIMVFHMLKKKIGPEAFDQGLRLFIQNNQERAATWDEIRTAMEKASGKNLGMFFDQWLSRKGLPVLDAGSASVKRKSDDFEIQISGFQIGDPYALEVPAEIRTADGTMKTQLLSLDRENTVSFVIHQEPRTLVADPDYDIARLPTPAETPALIKTALNAEQPLLVMPVSRLEAYIDVVARFTGQGATETTASNITNEDIKSASAVIVLGGDNPVIGKLFGSGVTMQAGFSMLARKNPWNERRLILVIDAASLHETEAALPHLDAAGAFAAAAFSRGSRVFTRTGESSKGVTMDLREEPAAIDLSVLKTLPDAIREAEKKRIIYVGEYHDKYEHHAVQLQVIRSLFTKGEKVAIGMEMFQRPFQPALDDYIQGRTDERTFLRTSEYFKRWVFDYNLYKPILDFARENRIPVVALNQRREITDKVAKSGLDSLTLEERKDVPPQMDFSDEDYRDRLKTVFGHHEGSSDRNFDYFYQAQVLWDETMALSIDEFLGKHPDYRMIVIAGGGHLAYGSGIPKRCFRRNKLPYFIAMNDGELDKAMADYIILPQPLEGTAAPKLMALLAVENNRVIVKDLPGDSVSKRAGVRTGDVILALDNETVQNVEDIRLALFFKKQGDILKVTVLRKRFWFGENKLDIDVKL
jgi:aminopeptidase N